MESSSLLSLRENLQEKLEHADRQRNYIIPALWVNDKQNSSARRTVTVDPYQFFLDAVNGILDLQPRHIVKTTGGLWTKDAVVYNMFIRTTCAFDHNGNGKIDLPENADGWKESGTFLKAIGLLPYVRSLGANTIHLLPIASMGKDGHKGTLGSPYAIKNPYELDPAMSEPNIGVGADNEFKAFVEASHRLGIRVVVEFVFRTSSKDSDWVKDHPDWFYWIKESVKDRQPHSHDESGYGAPIFTREEMQQIHTKVEKGGFDGLISPHRVYLDMFTASPAKESIILDNGKWIGILPDGTRVRIPGAFADWPPDDSQPPWVDVTYLKMYTHPKFNYIAYNTLRMYDRELAREENIKRPLWDKISDIVPHYQKTFGIDGVMIDMGHALPMALKREMIRRAREVDPDFAFWDENFTITEQSVREGYNAVIGYQWADQHHPSKFRRMLKRFSEEGYALPFFATPESHNTPRAATRTGGVLYSRFAWGVSNFIPAIPFIHSGFELGETFPVNTGLDFSKEEMSNYPPEQLPLFSGYAYDWASSSEIVEWIRKVSLVRTRFHSIITDTAPASFLWLETHHHDVVAFIRSRDHGKTGLLVVANSNMHQRAHCSVDLYTQKTLLVDIFSGTSFAVEGNMVRCDLSQGQVEVFEL